jgi:RNA polymerase sigma-70 factor (ECF subfamily)
MLQAMTRTDPAIERGEPLNATVQAAREGDPHAFEALYRTTVGTVYGLCLRLTADPTLAEECTQQCYVQAWRSLDKFRGASSVTTWLHRIAVNEVRGHFRRERRHDVARADEEPVSAPTDEGHARDLERAIATLPQRARSVFVLVGIYGYPHEEAARMLDIATGTSKAHYHRARRQLRALLGDQHESA